MKTGYSFGSLVSFTEALDAAAVKNTGDQTVAGVKTFSSNPISSAAQGTGGSHLTRKDYVDGALALKAPLASPALTGTPTAPTAEAGTNTTQVATTAFVTASNTAQIGTATPLMSGAAAVGVSTLLARQDHKHPTDTSRAPLDSPALSGNPTAPTAAMFANDTTLATTEFVQRALGNHQRYVLTGDATIKPGWAGCFIWYSGAGTLYLPNYASVSVGATFEIMCTGTGAITAQSGESIILPNGVPIASFTPLAGDTGKFVRLDTGWAYSGSNYCATAATGDRSTRPASTQFVRNYLESSPQLAGYVHVEGIVNITQEFQTTNQTSYRNAYGDYGTFWYQDHADMYLLLTNKGENWSSFNNLRPFHVNLATGRVGMSNGVSVGGGLTTDDFTGSGTCTAPTAPQGTNNTQIATTAFVQNLVRSSMPVGSIIYSAASTAPVGFLVCNGGAVSRTTYASLYACIGTTYGAGNGSTTFNLPDLRGEFIRGWDGGRGVDAGRGFGTRQLDAFQGHKHLPSRPVGYGGGLGDQNQHIGNDVTETPGTVDGGYGTPRISTETRPRNVALLPCIKY